jgi:hypothetical protein
MKMFCKRERSRGKRTSLFRLRSRQVFTLSTSLKTSLYFLLFTLHSLLSNTLAQVPSTLFPYAWNDRSIFAQNLSTESQSILEQLAGAPVYHLEWTLSEDLFKLEGKAEILVTNTSSYPWNNLVFRLYPNVLGSTMIVNSVLVDGTIVSPILEAENTVLRVPLSQALASTKSLVISINYTLNVSETVEAYGRLARFAFISSCLSNLGDLRKQSMGD